MIPLFFLFWNNCNDWLTNFLIRIIDLKIHLLTVINIGTIIPLTRLQLYIQCIFTFGSSTCSQYLFIQQFHNGLFELKRKRLTLESKIDQSSCFDYQCRTVVHIKAKSKILTPRAKFIGTRNRQRIIFTIQDDFLPIKTGICRSSRIFETFKTFTPFNIQRSETSQHCQFNRCSKRSTIKITYILMSFYTVDSALYFYTSTWCYHK